MSAQCEVTAKQAAGSPMGLFERYLSVWVFLCIAVGIGLGQVFPGFFHFVGRLEVAQINLPVALMTHIPHVRSKQNDILSQQIAASFK